MHEGATLVYVAVHTAILCLAVGTYGGSLVEVSGAYRISGLIEMQNDWGVWCDSGQAYFIFFNSVQMVAFTNNGRWVDTGARSYGRFQDSAIFILEVVQNHKQ